MGMRGAWRRRARTSLAMGHGDGDAVSLPLLERQWGSLLLPTESRCSINDYVERERDKEEEKKSCGFRGCLLSCPKRLTLGRQRLVCVRAARIVLFYILSATTARNEGATARLFVELNEMRETRCPTLRHGKFETLREICTALPKIQRELRAVSLGERGVTAGGWVSKA